MKVLYFLLTIWHYSYGNPVQGKSSNNQTLIIGGTYAPIRNYPCMAQLKIYFDKISFGKCGSTIIRDKALLSAAHCFISTEGIYNIRVSIGSAYPDWRGLKYYTKNYTIHSKYNKNWYDYDIAVVRTEREMYLDDRVSRAVKLPEKGVFIPEGTVVTIVGWGYTKVRGRVSAWSPLRSADVTLLSMPTCRVIHEQWRFSYRMLCSATNTKNIKDHCTGDSGGPALDKEGVQVGLITSSFICGTVGLPSMYMNVGMFRDWIRQEAHV